MRSCREAVSFSYSDERSISAQKALHLSIVIQFPVRADSNAASTTRTAWNPRPSINWPRPSLLDRIDESRQFGAKGFFRWKLQLVHRAFLRFYCFAIGHMLIRKRPYLVLCHIVIAHRRRTRPHNGDFTEFAGRMVTGLDRREYRGTVALVIFQNNQRFVIHSAAEKSLNTA